MQTIQNYELYLILQPNLNPKEASDITDSIQNFLTKELEASNLEVNTEGLRKLAYPIKHHTTGQYVLLTFDVELAKARRINEITKRLSINEQVLRYLLANQTEYLQQKAKEKLNKVEINNHRELNKGREKKICVSRYLGLKAIDYKDTEFLGQFTSPYAKIFPKDRTGSSSKMHRKITRAIKHARHMALLPFTAKHYT